MASCKAQAAMTTINMTYSEYVIGLLVVLYVICTQIYMCVFIVYWEYSYEYTFFICVPKVGAVKLLTIHCYGYMTAGPVGDLILRRM